MDQRIELPDKLPVVALRDLVFFPYMVLPLLIGRPRSLCALEEAESLGHGLLLLLSQKQPSIEEPERDDLFRVGTVARMVQVTRLQDGTCRVVLEGIGRARVTSTVNGSTPATTGCRPVDTQRGSRSSAPAAPSQPTAGGAINIAGCVGGSGGA